jgi:hypothetical protein
VVLELGKKTKGKGLRPLPDIGILFQFDLQQTSKGFEAPLASINVPIPGNIGSFLPTRMKVDA